MTSSTDPHRPFTTTLPVDLLHELDQAANETGISKKAILVEALTVWNTARKQALLAESYAREQNERTPE